MAPEVFLQTRSSCKTSQAGDGSGPPSSGGVRRGSGVGADDGVNDTDNNQVWAFEEISVYPAGQLHKRIGTAAE